MFRNLVYLLSAAVMLASCAGDNAAIKNLPPGQSMGVADPVKVETAQDYRLWPNDIIQIEVFNVASLTRTVQLDSSGLIDLPLLGRVPASGQTPFELAQKLQAAYGDKYLQNPQVSVSIRQARVDTITVDGSVQAPGVYPVTQKTSLVRAIALAKGLDQLANPKQIVVFRNVNNQRVAGLFDLQQIRSGQAPDPPIYPNDMIVVASSASRRTLRDIIGVTPLLGFLPLIP
jgi:polysaccharide export outer membrane protein